MKIEHKNFEFKIDGADERKGIIRGLASTFGNVDLGDDVVDFGAFKKTLKESGGKVPILADHDPSKPIGWNLRAEETEKGLMVEGRINLEDAYAKGRYELARQALEIGAKMGLSIGYSVMQWAPDKERPSVRHLKELKLYEYSLVTFPMNTSAMVTAAKSWADAVTRDEFIEKIKHEAKSRGMGLQDLSEALLKVEAAADEHDPVRLGQSLDNLINLIKGEQHGS